MSQPFNAQITFYYLDGETETFNIYDPVEAEVLQQELQQEFRRFLEKHWWILHLSDQTVCINTTNISKIEITPPIKRVQGEGVFANAQRVTALIRSSRDEIDD
jgi:hypothetical protein